jgi:uncharacterized membrane protein
MNPLRGHPRASIFTLLSCTVTVGAALRFWRIGSKPLWLDELVTALICLGRGPGAVPIGVAFPLARLTEMFSVNADAMWRDLVALLRDPLVQHTHPPLFYVVSHEWLAWVQPSLLDLAWTTRVVAAAFGVLAIPVAYAAAREAFDRETGLVAAALAAVSPYAVMLGQEARNYTLPLLITTCSLWATLAVVNRLENRRRRRAWWVLWIVSTVAGLYAHYFAALASAAQVIVLAVATLRARSRRDAVALVTAVAVVGLAFVPWLSTALVHVTSPEQHWMLLRSRAHLFMVGYETISAWQTMILGTRWDVASVAARVGSQVFALIFGLWVLAFLVAGLWRARRQRSSESSPHISMLTAIVALTLAELMLAVVVLRKDLLSQVRYHFVYYAPAAVLVAGVLTRLPERSPSSWRDRVLQPSRAFAIAALLLVGALNALLVDVGVEDWKPPPPNRIATRIAGSLEPPAVIVSGAGNFHEVVADLSYYVELRRHADARTTSVVFVPRGEGYVFFAEPSDPEYFWSRFAAIRGLVGPPRTVWVHDNGLSASRYPPTIAIDTDRRDRVTCAIVAAPSDSASDVDVPLTSPSYRQYYCSQTASGGPEDAASEQR